MSITSELLNLQIGQQQLDGMKAETALHTAQTQQLLKSMQADDQARDASQRLELARQASATKNQPPTTDEAFQGGEMQQAIAPLKAQLQDTASSIKMWRGLAADGRTNRLDPKYVEKYDKEANDAETKMTALQKELTAAQKDITGRAAGAFGSVGPDGSGLDSAVKDLNALLGKKWADNAPIDRDLLGNPAWGKRTQAFFDQQNQKALSANEQALARERAATLKETQTRDEETRREHQIQDKHREAQEINERERTGIMESREGREARKDVARLAKTEKLAKAAADPKSTEVKAEAAKMQKDLGLSAEDAPVAAMDLLRRTAQYMRDDPNISRDDARDDALDDIKSKIKMGGGKKGEHFWSKDVPDKPSYKPESKPTPVVQPKTADEYLKSIGGT